MNKHEKFLEFNGKKIIFLSVDGIYWIALKPICEALGVDYIRCFKNAKNDEILGPALSKQTIQVSKNGKLQGRNVTCIPEEFIYGWIFSLRSDSKELTAYRRTCYRLLYKHFHGTITNRKELLVERKEVIEQIHEAELEVKNIEAVQRLEKLKAKRAHLSTELNKSDKEIIRQSSLLDQSEFES